MEKTGVCAVELASEPRGRVMGKAVPRWDSGFRVHLYTMPCRYPDTPLSGQREGHLRSPASRRQMYLLSCLGPAPLLPTWSPSHLHTAAVRFPGVLSRA